MGFSKVLLLFVIAIAYLANFQVMISKCSSFGLPETLHHAHSGVTTWGYRPPSTPGHILTILGTSFLW